VTDYTLDRADAAAMLAEDGQSMTLTRRTSGAYDPATGSASITTTTQTVYGAIFPLSAFAKQQGNVVFGDQQCLLAGETTAGVALNPVPKVDDTLTDANSVVWSIISVEPLSPAGTDVLHDLVIRRAA
jgi:hypothetical protein